MNELLDDADRVSKSRPVVLIVACACTWVASAILFLVLGVSLIEMVDDEAGWWIVLAVLLMLSAIVSLAGSIMMFVRKRAGFLLYTIGQLVYVTLITGIFIGETRGRVFIEELFFLALFVCVPLGFILLYRSQREYFKKKPEQVIEG